MKDNIRFDDLVALLINSALAIFILIILTVSLGSLGLTTYTVPGIIGTSLLFLIVAFFNVFIRIAEASRLGYEYYYEHSFAYAILSFIVVARFYGFFPVLYLGGSRLAVDKMGRVGFDDIGTNHQDLFHVASLPLAVNIALCLALIPAAVQTSSWFIRTLGFILASYTLFSSIPWPYSNGLHVLSYDARTGIFYAFSSLVFVVFYALV